MSEPQIQYARTTDGVSIAYTTTGDGPPILYCHDHGIAMEHHWTGSAPANDTIRVLSGRTRVTIFDAAGIGASQRDVSDFTLAAQVRAIEAVAAHIAESQFTLIGTATATASAALYAAQQPGRVRELICVFPAFPVVRRTGAAIRDNWSLDRRRAAGAALPDGPVSGQRWYSNAMRESMAAEVYAAYRSEFTDADLSAIYRRIPVSTLLCIEKAGPAREASLALASVVPSCRVATTPDLLSDFVAALLEFMGIDGETPDPSLHMESSTPAAPATSSGMKAILFTDIADSTALTERMGDAAFRSTARSLDDRMRAAITGAGGSAVDGKLLGDGVMAVFTSAAQAIEAAQRCIELSAESELRLHVGLHAGDAIHEGGNVYGGAVNIAARVCALSAPGEILVSSTMRELARTSTGATFADRGEHQLKGIDDAVRIYAVRLSTK